MTRNPQPSGLAVALVYAASVLVLTMYGRARSIIDSLGRIPIFGYAVLFAYAMAVAVKVGHWPWYSAPDPKDLHWPLLTTPVVLIAHRIGPDCPD